MQLLILTDIFYRIAVYICPNSVRSLSHFNSKVKILTKFIVILRSLNSCFLEKHVP
ncbi:hypothetical protein KS164_04890 [Staphylococcus aureus]|nr:hypothetical protein [Staphylococcus aureus]MBV2980779.1 hypothetical protein [Staphylococcus aureus]